MKRPSDAPVIHDDLEHWVACWRWPVHYLKTVQPYYANAKDGFKNFEVRRNDRDFQPGDLLVLCEWTGEDYTGDQCVRKVMYVLRDAQEFGVQEGFVVLGLELPTKYDLGARRDKGSSS